MKSARSQAYINQNPEGIFGRKRDDPSKTYFIVGRSFSGKTTFLVNELNKLADLNQCCKFPWSKRPVYDLIVFFTESIDADPLKNLDNSIPVVFIKGYVPKIVLLLKKIQDATSRAFRFLVVFDDVVQGLRSNMATKLILTLRNSHISTCVCTQYIKMITPAMRNSIHEWYITGLKPEEWAYLLQGFLQSHAREYVGNIRSISQLAEDFKTWIDKDIFFYSNREDKSGLIERKNIS